MVYTTESAWEAEVGLGVGAASTDVITSAVFDLLEAKARQFINMTLHRGITDDITSPDLIIESVANLRIKFSVLNAQAASDGVLSGGDVIIQELKITGVGTNAQRLRAHAMECKLEAIGLLNRWANRDGTELYVEDTRW